MRTLIAVPCHEFVHADFMRCLMELDKPQGTSLAVIKNTLIYNARNLIAQNAVKEGFDNVLWLDSDMVFAPDTLKRLIQDAEENELDFVTGLCFTRKHPIKPCIDSEIHWSAGEDGMVDAGATTYDDYPKDSLFEIAGGGFACVLTSVKLLDAMVQRYGAPFYPLMGMGEDNTFCWRAKKEGFSLWCDSCVKVGHIGNIVFGEEMYKTL